MNISTMTEIIPPTADGIQKTASVLTQGGLVAIPTETVYGLAGDATNDMTVAKIFAAKDRPSFNPLIIHVASIEQAKIYTIWNSLAQSLANQFWPGPLTLVLPQRPHSGLSRLATANLGSVAIRIPAHPIAQAVIGAVDFPLAAPSANASGNISPTCAAHVVQSLGSRIDFVLDGGSSNVGLESTILDLTGQSPAVLRLGGLDINRIEKICGKIISLPNQADTPIKAPGMMLRHYAPSIPLRLDCHNPRTNEALLAFGTPVPSGFQTVINLSEQADLTEAAAKLYEALHQLDQGGHSGIATMPIPETGLGLAINDRLRRAAKGSQI